MSETRTPKRDAKKEVPAATHLQRLTTHSGDEVARVNVRLVLDEVHFYDENLPVDVVRGLLSPEVKDFFILIHGHKTIPMEKAHYLHTMFIREVLLFGEMPEE